MKRYNKKELDRIDRKFNRKEKMKVFIFCFSVFLFVVLSVYFGSLVLRLLTLSREI